MFHFSSEPGQAFPLERWWHTEVGYRCPTRLFYWDLVRVVCSLSICSQHLQEIFTSTLCRSCFCVTHRNWIVVVEYWAQFNYLVLVTLGEILSWSGGVILSWNGLSQIDWWCLPWQRRQVLFGLHWLLRWPIRKHIKHILSRLRISFRARVNYAIKWRKSNNVHNKLKPEYKTCLARSASSSAL